MVFNTGAALLDAIVLAVVSNENEGTYGYKITQDVRQVLEVSESTLYPVLRRLLKDQCLETYDREYGGRNRRYYKITEKGTVQLNLVPHRAEKLLNQNQHLVRGRDSDMNRKEFLAQLARLLWDIPEADRKDALEYYENYFEDAGVENESSVIQELGSPGKVAAIIKTDLEGGQDEAEKRNTAHTRKTAIQMRALKSGICPRAVPRKITGKKLLSWK